VATLGEARIMAADGSVIPQARAEFEEVLKAEPKDPRARFYIAVAETQAGNMMRGLDQLVGIARDATPDAPYLPMLRERIGALANELKQDPAKLLAALPKPVEPGPAPQAQTQTTPPAVQAPAPPRQERGPSAADVAAAQQMSPQDRQQMIRGMVDGLAARMEQNPNDVEGWLRLIRAYKVLGDDAKAVEAAGKASAANPGAMPQIVALSNQLGLGAPAPTQAAAAPRPVDAQAIRSGASSGDPAPFRQRLATNPNDREALWQVGLAEVAAGNKFEAVELWGRLLGQFDPASAEYAALRERLDALKRGG
jgi:cytochrome c-type biogenesis protein CcmH